MSSNLTSSRTLSSTSSILSSIIVSSTSTPLNSTSSPASQLSTSVVESPTPLPSPSPSPSPSPLSSSDFLPSSSAPLSSESGTSYPTFSSESSIVTSQSSVLAVASSSTQALNSTSTSSTLPLGTALSGNNSGSTSAHTNSLKPVEIAAIALGVSTALLGIAALLLVFLFRSKRRRHLPYTREDDKGTDVSSRSDLDRETPSDRSYFRSLSEQKGTTPLLQTPDPHDERYRDYTPMVPSHSFSHQEFITQKKTFPQSALPSKPQEDSQLPSLTIPVYVAPNSHPRSPTHGSDAVPAVLPYADENVDADSPSIYSQSSGNFRFSSYTTLSRGPSISSRVTVHRISVPPTLLEVPRISGGSSEGQSVDTGSEDGRSISGETITPATRGPISIHPASGGLDLLETDPSQQQQHSHLNRDSGLERQNTVAIASLLKTRQQRQSESLPITSSGMAHIEHAGSIRPVHDLAVGPGTGDNEPYGRRFRRLKAQQGN